MIDDDTARLCQQSDFYEATIGFDWQFVGPNRLQIRIREICSARRPIIGWMFSATSFSKVQ